VFFFLFFFSFFFVVVVVCVVLVLLLIVVVVVVVVGSGARDQSGNVVPLEVKVGDTVMYGKWGGTEVKVNGNDVIIMKESDVIGILTK
jgi:hypothetical protein